MEHNFEARSARAAFVSQRSRRGSVMMVAMAFVVVVGIAGSVILSLSYAHQVQMQQKALSVRMMAAAEAGIETKRGRFTLIQGVQDDWLTLMPLVGWNNIDAPMTINGMSVQVQAMPVGSAAVPRARIRGVVSTISRQLAVEYEIKVASFSDYALYSGSTAVSGIGANFNMVGTYYSLGGIDLGTNPGIRFWGLAKTSGTIVNPGEPMATIFQSGWQVGIPPIQIPPTAYGFGPPFVRAKQNDTVDSPARPQVHYRNTVAIEFLGTQYRRYYYIRRNAAGPTNMTGLARWHNTANGNIVASSNTHWLLTSEVRNIPDEGVIFLRNAPASIANEADAGAPGGASGAVYSYEIDTENATYQNDFQQATYASLPISNQASSPLGPTVAGPVAFVWGRIDDRRVTLASEYKLVVSDCIKYDTLATNPDLRRQANKTGAGATNFKEMLGVVSGTEIQYIRSWFTPLAPSEMVTNIVGDTGHLANQYSLDAVFMGVYRGYEPEQPASITGHELWECGCLINGQFNSTWFAGVYQRRNYDWDWRLQNTTPPYFLRAYNTSATFLPGTWRSYEF